MIAVRLASMECTGTLAAFMVASIWLRSGSCRDDVRLCSRALAKLYILVDNGLTD